MIFFVTVGIKSYEVCFGVLALSLGRLCVCLAFLWFATKNATSSVSGGISYNYFLMEDLKLTKAELAENHVLNIYCSALFFPKVINELLVQE